MADLEGKVAVITGATTGIGEATAIEFARYKTKLVICGRNLAGLQNTKEKCVQIGLKDKDVCIVTGDICQDETLDMIVKTVMDSFGRVDVLFLNAGKSHAKDQSVFVEKSTEALDNFYEIFIKSPYKLTQKLSSELIKNKGAIIINGSICGSSIVGPNVSAYSILKACQEQMTRLFALTFADKGVRVNGIKPGLVCTNLQSDVRSTHIYNPDVVFDMMDPLTPLDGKLSTAEEISRVVVFLASNQSSCMTGTLHVLDKGFTMTHPAVDWKQF